MPFASDTNHTKKQQHAEHCSKRLNILSVSSAVSAIRARPTGACLTDLTRDGRSPPAAAHLLSAARPARRAAPGESATSPAASQGAGPAAAPQTPRRRSGAAPSPPAPASQTSAAPVIRSCYANDGTMHISGHMHHRTGHHSAHPMAWGFLCTQLSRQSKMAPLSPPLLLRQMTGCAEAPGRRAPAHLGEGARPNDGRDELLIVLEQTGVQERGGAQHLAHP